MRTAKATAPLAIWALALATWAAPLGSARGATVRSRVDRSETTLGEPILLTIEVEGEAATQPPRLPELAAFEVQYQGQSSQVQIVNGRMSSSVGYNYILEPKQPGSYVLGPAQVTVGGRTYQTQPITVRVLPAGRRALEGGQEAFITASISEAEPYVGEQIVYVFRFYRRVRVAGARAQLPDFDGFTAEDLGEQSESVTEHQGQRYVVTEIKKALFPQEAGDIAIPAAALVVELQAPDKRRRADPFDDVFGDPFGGFFGPVRTVKRTLRSSSLAVRVRALPPAPAGFSGLVGAFEMRANATKSELRVSDSTTLEITVTGRGNIGAVAEPSLPALPAFKVYDDKPEAKVHVEGDALTGHKLFRKALVPREAGDLVVPAIGLVFFDPGRGEYRTARSEPITLHVLAAEGGEPLHVAGTETPGIAAKRAVEVLGDDILPIRTRARLWTANEWSFWVRAAGAAIAFPPIAFAITAIALYRRERFAADRRLARRRGALERTRRALAQAKKAATSGQASDALRGAERALKELIGDELDLAGAALTPAEIEGQLTAAGLSPELVRRVHAHVSALEVASFGGGTVGATEPLAAIGTVEELVRDLHRACARWS